MPRFAVSGYHFVLAFLANLAYGAPSKKMFVIGVTGTKGKTTTVNLLADILNAAGHKTGVTSSVYFRFGSSADFRGPDADLRGHTILRRNETKQGMPGRFQLQKLLAEMVRKGCTHAIVETTSEGMLQYRHRFIDYNAAIFTNLSPEHIERHGGLEKYRETKIGLFKMITQKKDGIGVYNLDEQNVEFFLKPDVPRKFVFSLGKNFEFRNSNFELILNVLNLKTTDNGSEFDIRGVHFVIPLIGEFNVYNAAGAIAMAQALGVSLEKCAEALRNPTVVSGRFEVIRSRAFGVTQDDNHDFVVIVDYAHEPRSLEEAYRATKIFLRHAQINAGVNAEKRGHGRLICLLGSQGGGRDKWKRAEMGRVAARYCDEIVLTNEDPYDENPSQILSEIKSGIFNFPASPAGRQFPISKVHEIIDRREAIKKAISLARTGDVVILTGKGGEVWMCVENGKKIPWDETGIVREALRNHK